MSNSFRRPVGVNADIAELKYIASLHQTCQPDLRTDGSIKAIDIVCFLSSRYGIRVSEDQIRNTVMKGLGGGDEEEECIDLTEMVAILLIPLLKKAASDVLYDGGDTKMRKDFRTNWEYDEYLKRMDIANSLKPDPHIIRDVLGMILMDTTGDAGPRSLDKDLLKQILKGYGEFELAEDDDLLEEMIAAATNSGSVGDGSPALTKEVFATALTSDVKDYDVNTETSVSTNFYDVFGFEKYLTTSGESKFNVVTSPLLSGGQADYSSTDVESKGSPDGANDDVEKVFMFPSIDYTVGLYRSKTFVVVLWFTAVFSYFSYMVGADTASFANIDQKYCETSSLAFVCKVANSVIVWTMVFLQLSVMGTAFIGLGSIGNDIYSTSVISILIGMASVAFFTIIPFFYEIRLPFVNTEKVAGEGIKYTLSFFGGCILLLLQFFHLVRLCIPKKVMEGSPRLQKFFTPGLTRYEGRIKRAAASKVNRMVKNATEIHKSGSVSPRGVKEMDTSYGRALLNFTKLADKYERVGGLFWVLGRWRNGKLFTEEGVWLSSRLVAGNFSQIFVCFFIFIGGARLAIGAREIFFFLDSLDENEILPQPWMLQTAIWVATFFGFFSAAYITLVYIPSSVSTILMFRCGAIPSLTDPGFSKYRLPDNERVTLLFGTLFWGALSTALWISFLVGFIVTLLLWQITRPFVVGFCATMIGLAITIGVKLIVFTFLRKAFYVAFYRNKPAQANFAGLVVECWNLGLTTGYMIGRAAMLILATALYLGRVDVPFLSPYVGKIGPMTLDAFPVTFRKDLLLHDAHRHPYIERLGVMYMLKLRHGDNFGQRAGSCWRLLFVFALMPWMRRYRIESRPHLQEGDIDPSLFKFGSQNLLKRSPLSKRSNASNSEEQGEIQRLRQQVSSLKKEIEELKKS